MRQCKDCGSSQADAAWVTKHGNPSGLLCLKCTAARRKAYMNASAANREMALKATKSWAKNNLEYRQKTCREYYHLPEVKARILAARAEVNEAQREIWRARCRAWSEKNKVYKLVATRKYTLGKLQRTPKWLTSKDYKLIEAKYAMAKWLGEVVGALYHVDHIVPLQGKLVSGLHVPDNLCVLQAKLNISKGNKYA